LRVHRHARLGRSLALPKTLAFRELNCALT
jgi:hypothetical protein